MAATLSERTVNMQLRQSAAHKKETAYDSRSSGRILAASGDRRRRRTVYGSGSTSDRSLGANVLSIGRPSMRTFFALTYAGASWVGVKVRDAGR